MRTSNAPMTDDEFTELLEAAKAGEVRTDTGASDPLDRLLAELAADPFNSPSLVSECRAQFEADRG